MELDMDKLLTFLEEKSLELTANAAEPWQGDSANDVVARSMVAATRHLMDGMTEALRIGESGESVNPVLLGLAIKSYQSLALQLKALRTIADLRK